MYRYHSLVYGIVHNYTSNCKIKILYYSNVNNYSFNNECIVKLNSIKSHATLYVF